MLAAGLSSRAVFLVLTICLIGSTPTYPQSAAFFNASRMPGNRLSSGTWRAKCEASSVNLLGASRFADGLESPPTINRLTANSNAPRPAQESCLDAASSAPARVLADNPCLQNVTGIPLLPRTHPCPDVEDSVPAQLSALGKAGLKITRAREEVLDILRSQNACTEWFETKEATPAAIFQTLALLLDPHGPQDVFMSMKEESIVVMRQPYVARATQDGGAHTAITINANGAFFRPQGLILRQGQETSPLRADGTRFLTVGIYRGDTLPAQILTLLHELGHIIDLLPEDADNLDGKSVQNTNEVLRHCRSEVEARAQQAKLASMR
jgi:hypothetical protein